MPTVQDCIDGLLVAYPLASSAQALTYFRQTHRELLAQAQIKTGSEAVNLVAGQREYTLSTTDKIVNVRAAYLVKSATDVRRLSPVSTDWLDQNKPTWRAIAERGDPAQFYVEDSKLGLDPVPILSTSSGFPQVWVYGTTYQALVATDPIPEIVPTIRVYIEGMKRLYASDRDPDRFTQWDAVYRRELHAALAHFNGLVEDLESPRLVPAWMRNRRIE